MAVIKNPWAIALCDQILTVHGSDHAITDQIDALAHAIERLDLICGLDYTLVIVSR